MCVAFVRFGTLPIGATAAGADAPGYMPTGENVVFAIVSGQGTKNATFAPKTAGEGLDPAKKYVATHSRASDAVSVKVSGKGDKGQNNIFAFKTFQVATIPADNSDAVSPNMLLWSKVDIVDGKVEPLNMVAVYAVMEFRLWQSSSMAGDYKVKSVKLNCNRTYVYYQAHFNFTTDFELNYFDMAANNPYTINVDADLSLSKDPSAPTVIRAPFYPRQNASMSSSYVGNKEVKITPSVVLESDGGSRVTKTFPQITMGSSDNPNVIFPAGKTFVKEFEVE